VDKKNPKSGVIAPLILIVIKFGHANRPSGVNISHRRVHVHLRFTRAPTYTSQILQQGVVELLAPFHYAWWILQRTCFSDVIFLDCGLRSQDSGPATTDVFRT